MQWSRFVDFLKGCSNVSGCDSVLGMLRLPMPLLLPIVIGFATQCGGEKTAEQSEDKADNVSMDASSAPVLETVIPPPSTPPQTGTHLDSAGSKYTPLAKSGSATQATSGQSVQLILRSTPPGATASIDGRVIGVTPTFWSGVTGHVSHEFTFVKKGYSMSRYRFVAVQSGVVHASLSPLIPGAIPKEDSAHK